jgi:hypothetical protein
MYSVMAIFKSSVLWGLFEYTEFFLYCNHQVHRDFLITLYFLPTQYIYVLCMDLCKTSDYIAIEPHWLGLIPETECVYCAVRTESLNILVVSINLGQSSRAV